MPKLIATPPFARHSPVHAAGITLQPWHFESLTSLMPFEGQLDAVTKDLLPLGLSFPQPNRMVQNGGVRLVWTGADQAFLMNAPLETGHAATTDQSDGWAGIHMSGDPAHELLMRLYPLDLRPRHFAAGHCARAPLGHMASILMRDETGFQILVFRSMADYAWHEIEQALHRYAARAAIRA